MSDENKTENDDWRLNSFEEEDDIIELTEEIEPPSGPAPSQKDPQDQLDEIVIDLEDTAILEADDEVHDLMDAALEDTELDEITPLEETEEPLFDLEDEAVLTPDDDAQELMEAAFEDTGLGEISSIEEAEELSFEAGNESVMDFDSEVHELMAAADDGTESEIIAPVEETEEQFFNFEDEPKSSTDDEVHELMEAAIDDVGFDEAEAAGDPEDIALDFETEILSGSEEQAHELQDDAATGGDLNDRLLHDDAEKLEFEFAEDDSAEPYEQIEELSVTAMEEIGLEDMPPEENAAEFGTPDIETEVDIAEVADLEPIQSELPPQEPPEAETGAVLQLREELQAEPEVVIELQEELTADLADPVISGTEDIIEISDFDQQYFSDEEAQNATTGQPTADSAEEEDYLELIDIEEGDDDGGELDDEIIHFDPAGPENSAIEMDDILTDPDQSDYDLEAPIEGDSQASSDYQPPPAEELSNESAAASLLSGADEFLDDPPIPGFFDSTAIDADPETEITALAEPVKDVEAQEAKAGSAAVIPAAVSAAQIEAAVASIIERDYAGQIESMVAAAIEKVVTLEIERIKSSLFGDDED